LVDADNVGTGLANVINPAGRYNTLGATGASVCARATGASVGNCELGYAGVQIVTGGGVAAGGRQIIVNGADDVARATGTALDDAGRQVGGEMNPPVTAGGTPNSSTGAQLNDDLLARMVNPTVSDPQLAAYLNRLNRPTGTVGNGSTAAAVRQELRTGLPVNGSFHSQKAQDAITHLERQLRRTNLSSSDRRTIENVVRDLRNALGGN
jgi:hypothetical protein